MKRLLYICLIAVSATSCERVIDINLNSADKKYVIEGNVTEGYGTTTVLISQTKDFDEDNDFSGIEGATVTISDNNGTPVTLLPDGPGVYTTRNIMGQVGHTYSLKVVIGSQEITARSTMPRQVQLEKLTVTEEMLFGELRKYANVSFSDPVGKGNCYRFIQYVNNRKEKTYFVYDDDLTDGKSLDRRLLFFNDNDDEDRNIKSGDMLKVVMQCIDYPMYKYWYSLDASSTGSNQQATPANPVSNLQGDALGYFSAHTVQSLEVQVR
ncbi:DUF4249 domain-containing protein [Filimonas effusa]|uniref:DUF4249 domain-containing protein n=1 Tax=Filimonas effusa TaxID=2508721 RepID=A0A4Q1DF76_9BACT|nr:DUF4249 domain-containing protein [Filimonas effusa]RXK87289.1 DUF4249 domain-containing protein [Filimonas effusa]